MQLAVTGAGHAGFDLLALLLIAVAGGVAAAGDVPLGQGFRAAPRLAAAGAGNVAGGGRDGGDAQPYRRDNRYARCRNLHGLCPAAQTRTSGRAASDGLDLAR